MRYADKRDMPKKSWTKKLAVLLGLAVVVAAGYFTYQQRFDEPTIEEAVNHEVTFDTTVTSEEQEQIKSLISSNQIKLESPVSIRAVVATAPQDMTRVLEAYLPVTTFKSVKQRVTNLDLIKGPITMSDSIGPELMNQLAKASSAAGSDANFVQGSFSDIADDEVALVPQSEITSQMKLLGYQGAYYYDDFDSGAIFRELVIDGEGAWQLSNLVFNDLPKEDSVLKFNQTGVTALTRVMQRKLATVGDPLYFSELIGEFLADADVTHVSNEVSFKDNCPYSNTLFCSPPEFIETLKASGVDLVEITGNHNNDLGSIYNTQTIEQYRALGWDVVGGGLNTADAAKPHLIDLDGSKITVLAYNFPDSPNGGAISGLDRAGANSFEFDRIESEITAAKSTSDFVIVDVQYWECYAYPNGYVEYPLCDKPIGEQEAHFKKLIDLGADMVVGTSAHQPQTYELYNGKPIYYGLGNMYFDQTSWPGTERGIILTHYFVGGELLQTKLTPTVFDRDLQTRKMTDTETDYLLSRLKTARN